MIKGGEFNHTLIMHVLELPTNKNFLFFKVGNSECSSTLYLLPLAIFVCLSNFDTQSDLPAQSWRWHICGHILIRLWSILAKTAIKEIKSVLFLKERIFKRNCSFSFGIVKFFKVSTSKAKRPSINGRKGRVLSNSDCPFKGQLLPKLRKAFL